MLKFAGTKELLIKFATLKYAKRMCGIWINYIIGVLTKIKQALEVPCFSEPDYFKHAYKVST
jgi:hypothetical protein